MFFFIVDTPLNIGFEIDVEADVAVWHINIDPVDV